MGKVDKMREWLKKREFWKFDKPSLALQFLYDAEEFYRFRGAEALGYLCKGETARNFILRLFWHLSDESGAYCIGAPLGIAEIGRTNPEVFEGFRNKFVSLIDDWEVEKKYVVYGIGRVAHLVKDAYPNPVKKIKETLREEDDATVLAYSVLTAKKLGIKVEEGDGDEVRALNQKVLDSEVVFYNGERMIKAKLADVLNMEYTW